jgi:CRISPR-associated endonuclease/helicase Cas3
MTASLSEARRRALEDADGGPLEPIGGEPTIEEAPRYRLATAERDEALQMAREAAASGRKVLWVVNTVARAQVTYRDLAGEGLTCFVYHSRFRYQDRVQRQQDVLAAFRRSSGCLVVVTQVCEMSLDISAELLVTEVAPFPALVQRLGRLNRREPVPPVVCDCLVIPAETIQPYLAVDLEGAREFIDRLAGRPLSQADLADALAAINEPGYDDRATAFLEQTCETYATELRQTTPGVTVVRQCDVEGLTPLRRKDIVRNEIPMTQPLGGVPRSWPRECGTLVVPDGALNYSLEEGASWVR